MPLVYFIKNPLHLKILNNVQLRTKVKEINDCYYSADKRFQHLECNIFA